MTGNNKFWRASLAGLASVAMLATMGVSAANAATSTVTGTDGFTGAVNKANTDKNYTVNVYDTDKPYEKVDQYTRNYGQVVTAADLAKYNEGEKFVVDYLSYDQAGTEKVATPYVVTGDVKLFAHYKEAVTVTFDTNNNGKADDADKSVNIPKGSELTAAEYQQALGTVSNGYTVANETSSVLTGVPSDLDTFVGWTTDYTNDASTSSSLYTGGAVNADTVLYQRWDNKSGSVNTGKNLAEVEFRNAGETTAKYTAYTLNGKLFQSFRAPAGTWKVTLEGADYDFSTPVANKYDDKADLTLVQAVSASAQDVTVNFLFGKVYGKNVYSTVGVDHTVGAIDTTGTVTTTSDQKIAEPKTPVAAGAVFTGWYTSDPSINTKAAKYDFSKSVAENFSNTGVPVTLYAGWDTTNVSAFAFNLGYEDWGNAQQVWFVYKGKSYDLPKLEEYFQTADQNNANKGEYTTRQLTGWKWGEDTVTKATAPTAQKVYVFDANWVKAASVKLDANGGKFGEDTVKWVTKNPDQSWADVVVTPTRDGYSFVGWRNLNQVNTPTDHRVEGKLRANLSDGYWYEISTGKQYAKIADGDQLKAEWKLTSDIDIAGLRDHFGIKHGAANRTNDIKTVANFGYTEESAAKYVDAVNALEDEYKALESLTGDKLVAAKNALAAKYYAAEALLVKSDVPVEPAPATKVPVYRLYNKYITTGTNHLFTTDESEYNLLSAKGWTPEGVVFESTSDKNATPVYRLYNQYDGSHHYTKDAAERDNLVKLGWTYEKVGFYAPADGDATLYRLYNQYNGEHLFTTDKAENDKLVSLGWTAEESGLKVYSAAK